ncbi:hypothetical protein MNV49_005812 [Pseudohyphozyma bogoriensis]|nr:hypothetical protein MNV49_005812 [Pseudohyphozyma bogoriensis]
MPFLAKIKTLFSSAPTPSTSTNQPSVTITPPTPFLASSETPAQPTMAPTPTDSPAFDPSTVKVVFVLGGPGAGKGTQCAKLVDDQGFVHLSAGDLLRAEQQRPGSTVGAMIKQYIKEGTIVPMEVTIKLLENAMREAIEKKKSEGQSGLTRFLIDGFPRQMDQAIKFDESVCESSLILFLVCPEEELLKRLLKRGETSGRDDDNAESIKKRFQTFINTSMPVVEYYRGKNKVVDVDSSKTVEEVHQDILVALKPVL